eukprot:4303573-Amphidinium_carterae.1
MSTPLTPRLFTATNLCVLLEFLIPTCREVALVSRVGWPGHHNFFTFTRGTRTAVTFNSSQHFNRRLHTQHFTTRPTRHRHILRQPQQPASHTHTTPKAHLARGHRSTNNGAFHHNMLHHNWTLAGTSAADTAGIGRGP